MAFIHKFCILIQNDMIYLKKGTLIIKNYKLYKNSIFNSDKGKIGKFTNIFASLILYKRTNKKVIMYLL